jgi:RNA polymerase sigma-70 factor (ECF subfamily)
MPLGSRPRDALGADRGGDPTADPARWLEAFHQGDSEVLEWCYRQHFALVDRAVGRLLEAADRETVIHELFFRLIGRPELRRAFQGGSFPAWLSTVARNQAIDYRRRLGREAAAITDASAEGREPSGFEEDSNARLLVEQFRREWLPPAWRGVFEVRFIRQLSQREAAAELGMRRTTLAYRELRIRRALRRFLLGGDE